MLDSTLGASADSQQHSPDTLLDRVMARVSDAGAAVDRRAAASRPRASRKRPSVPRVAETRSPDEVRTAQSLRRVFHDLGLSYREHRRLTGSPVSPDVRDAASRFREKQDVPSLVAVAASLQQVNALRW